MPGQRPRFAILLSKRRVCTALSNSVGAFGRWDAKWCGLGHSLNGDTDAFGLPAAFGRGGATGFADPKHRLALGYTRNLFTDDDGRAAILAALRRALGLS